MKKKINIEATGYVTSFLVCLEGLEVALSYDGDKTYKATVEINIIENLDLIYIARGFNGTEWEIKLSIYGDVIYKKNGSIDNNFSRIVDSIKIKEGNDK